MHININKEIDFIYFLSIILSFCNLHADHREKWIVSYDLLNLSKLIEVCTFMQLHRFLFLSFYADTTLGILKRIALLKFSY